jgi:hypothetical protein
MILREEIILEIYIYTKQQIDFFGQADLEETRGQQVVIQTSDKMYLILYEYIVLY